MTIQRSQTNKYITYARKDIQIYLRSEFTTNNQLLVAIDGSFSTQLGHEKLENVIRVTVHRIANLIKICPMRFLGTHYEKDIAYRHNNLQKQK